MRRSAQPGDLNPRQQGRLAAGAAREAPACAAVLLDADQGGMPLRGATVKASMRGLRTG